MQQFEFKKTAIEGLIEVTPFNADALPKITPKKFLKPMALNMI